MRSKPLRVACIGNMNNNMFSLVRYLRDLEIEAHLFLLCDEYTHFLPEADTFSDDYKLYTTRLSWGGVRGFRKTDPRLVKRDLAGFDRIIACGPAIAYIARAGLHIDVFTPYGSDLYYLPYIHIVHPRVVLDYWALAHWQRIGIGAASVICIDVWGEISGHVAKLAPRARRITHGLPMLHLPTYSAQQISENVNKVRYAKEFSEVRRGTDFLIGMQSRHEWTNRDVLHGKGIDRLLIAFERFSKQRGDLRCALVTFEYGSDVIASRELIRQLGIGKDVHWLPMMHRKEIMCGLSSADVLTGEFLAPCFSCGVIYEALALNKPIVHNRLKGNEVDVRYPYPYWYYQAETVDEIIESWHKWTCNREREKPRNGRHWLEDNVINPVLRTLVEHLQRKST